MAALVAAVAAGCGTQTTDGQPTFADQPPTNAELTAALITAADLPAGFAVDPDDSEDEDGPVTPARCDQGVLSDDAPGSPVADVEVGMVRGPVVAGESAASYQRPATVAGILDDVAIAMRGCRVVTERYADGTRVITHTSTMRLPTFGDRSLAYHATLAGPGGTAAVVIVYIQVHNCLIGAGSGTVGAEANVHLAARVADAAATRLESVCR